MHCEHKCPCCGHLCLYDREGHRCHTCRHVHSAPVATMMPLDLHIPGPDPVRDEELRACVIVAEIHALKAFRLRYREHHRGDDGGLHLVVQFGNGAVELKDDCHSDGSPATMEEDWQTFKDYLAEHGIFGMRAA